MARNEGVNNGSQTLRIWELQTNKFDYFRSYSIQCDLINSQSNILPRLQYTYWARYFPSKLMDIRQAGFLSSLLCPILFHVLMSQTAVTDLLPVIYFIKEKCKFSKKALDRTLQDIVFLFPCKQSKYLFEQCKIKMVLFHP